MIAISALYDSHVHWLMTGEKKSYFDLQSVTHLSELNVQSFQPMNFRGEWLFGFGWNDSQLGPGFPVDHVDSISTDFPICFIKKDAHSCLLNSNAVSKVISILESNPATAPFIERNSSGRPTGIFKETAFYAIYPLFPALTEVQIQNYLLNAQGYFLENGFTHIRDMTCSIPQWRALEALEKKDKIRIFADINFNAENLIHAREILLPFVLHSKKELYPHLSIKGIKIFIDGSLGSESAWLSENYRNQNHSGFGLWSESDTYQLMKLCWQNNLEVSTHTLGDKAVDFVVDIARQLYAEKIRGYLNLEHVQLVRPETISKMKSLFVRCHMQPSHWLSDRRFLENRLSSNSMKFLFAWEALRKAKVPVSFGSDSPIEEANVALTLAALQDSAEKGIDSFSAEIFDAYKHPNPTQTGVKRITYLESGKIVKVE